MQPPPRGIQLHYSFDAPGQQGAGIAHPLFDLLAAVERHGSIRHAAQSMGSSYRHVWGALKQWEEALGEPLVAWVQGKPARLTPFAHRLMWTERQARTRMAPQIEALRAELRHVLAQAQDADLETLTVHAGHDPALSLLREQAAAQRLHLRLHPAGSLDALAALAAGRCTVAALHLPALPQGSPVYAAALKPLLKPGQHVLIGCASRSAGLMLRRDERTPIRGDTALADLVAAQSAGRLRFIDRQPGSATRLLMHHLLHAQGIAPEAIAADLVPPEDSRLAVAAAIASGQADIGPGTEAAAADFGLRFVPLVEAECFLVCTKAALDTPAVMRLREVLAEPGFGDALEAVPGYRSARPGEVLSVGQALPWWNGRAGRQAG
jgi:putative molybdopterin biosynthesis protein